MHIRKHAILATTFLSFSPVIAAGIARAGTTALTQITSSYTTPQATAELQQICPQGVGYPTAWTWLGRAHQSPFSAKGGTPKIEQYRGGALIATYSSFSDQPSCQYAGDGSDALNPQAAAATGCGPFTRSHSFALWAPGDTFLVYPAIYSGPYNNPYVGPEYASYAAWLAGVTQTPDNVLVQGVVQNNTRPVILLDGPAADNTLGQGAIYFDRSNGFHMDSINVLTQFGAYAGKAGVYEAAGSNLTLSNMRIAGFARIGVNGVFGAGLYSGTLSLDHVELDHNGGTNGPAHNAYIGASQIDPNFTVSVTHSWSHDAFYGHLFKSRAQQNIFIANYFEGALPWGEHKQAENYLLDIPNGGNLVARNNVFVKKASGPNSNAMSLTFAMEGFTDARPQSVDIENNTFVTFAKTFDGTNIIYPLSLFYPNLIPGTPSWPANIPARVIKNAFVGYCDQGGPANQTYRGELSLTESFPELSQTYSFSTKVIADDAWLATILPNYTPVVGAPAYNQRLVAQPVRQQMTLGAED